MPGVKRIHRVLRRVIPSFARLSYNPAFRIIGNAVSAGLGLPFPEFRKLPPNHLRVRVGGGNRMFNNHVQFLNIGAWFWSECFAKGYARADSDIVEIGCGCGRLAIPLNQDYFEGTYLGVDIDAEMIAYCRGHFPPDRFTFMLSPQRSSIYGGGSEEENAQGTFAIAGANSKDLVFSAAVFTHLLEDDLTFYLRESFRVLRPDGKMVMSFFCTDYVEKGGRWTFAHQMGNAYVESLKYPEAAIAYAAQHILEMARGCGFRQVSVRGKPSFSVLYGEK